MFILFQRYEFESKSQRGGTTACCKPRCLSYFKDTNLKANHNFRCVLLGKILGVYPISKIRIWKQITTMDGLTRGQNEVFILFQRYEFESKSQPLPRCLRVFARCLSYFKDTNLKANHNSAISTSLRCLGVYPISKIRIWKQITTWEIGGIDSNGCLSYFKDTNLKPTKEVREYL